MHIGILSHSNVGLNMHMGITMTNNIHAGIIDDVPIWGTKMVLVRTITGGGSGW